MSFKKRFKKNASRPEGILGRILISRMNIGTHYALAQWGLGNLNISENASALDIGCGGGANVKKLLGICKNGRACGVDYSPVSVEKSKKYNKREIKNGRCEILQADVRSLPFENESFDAVTAFETVYFWQDINSAFREVYRVTKPKGCFAVVQETDGKSSRAQETSALIDGMSFYTPEEIQSLLKQAGFKKTEKYRHSENGWFTVVGIKE